MTPLTNAKCKLQNKLEMHFRFNAFCFGQLGTGQVEMDISLADPVAVWVMQISHNCVQSTSP